MEKPEFFWESMCFFMRVFSMQMVGTIRYRGGWGGCFGVFWGHFGGQARMSSAIQTLNVLYTLFVDNFHLCLNISCSRSMFSVLIVRAHRFYILSSTSNFLSCFHSSSDTHSHHSILYGFFDPENAMHHFMIPAILSLAKRSGILSLVINIFDNSCHFIIY